MSHKREHYFQMEASRSILLAVIAALCVPPCRPDKFDEEEYGVRYATDCEVCKVVTLELTRTLGRTAGRHEVLETGYSVEREKKKTKYAVSELRLVEALDTLCEGLLRYNIHKERSDWTRFAPGMSETFQVGRRRLLNIASYYISLQFLQQKPTFKFLTYI